MLAIAAVLCTIHPAELAIGNIVRRVLHMIREEQQQEQLEQSEVGSTPDAKQEQKGVRAQAQHSTTPHAP